jgi:SpoIID/LytB domain protein
MKTLNKLLKKEPKMLIGIVIPEDKQSELDIKINGSDFLITLDQNQMVPNQQEISIRQLKNGLLVNGTQCNEMHIQNNSRAISNNIYLSPIKAGRGFHWQKSIPIQVLGDIRISSFESSLFVVNAIYLEDYLMCVATSEMSGDCPKALLEAQTIAARSWILAAEEKKHNHLNLDACNDDCCQRYQGITNLNQESIKATNNTRGIVLIHNGMICDARYSKSCGGITEDNNNVWDMDSKPYLCSVYDGKSSKEYDVSSDLSFRKWLSNETSSYCSPNFIAEKNLDKFLGNVDKQGSYYRWSVSYDNNELVSLVFAKTGKKFKTIINLKTTKRGNSGRVLSLDIIGVLDDNTNFSLSIGSEYEIRRILHPEFLYSSAFTIESNSEHNNKTNRFTLNGAGWGHGVGLCQIGALGMALDGGKTEEILLHYYQSSQIRNLYE